MKLPELRYGDLLPRWAGDEAEKMAERGTAVLKKITRSAPSSSTCSPGNDSGICQKPTDSTSTQTLPIVLGVVIPISCAIIVFVWLHRRNNRKQALEDSRDPHKSLDFGLDPSMARLKPTKQKRGKKGVPEMAITDPFAEERKMRGLSMDMLGSPYMLPAGLNGSRESLHSMTRSMRDYNDPYRPIAYSRQSSERSRPFNENASTYSGSTMHGSSRNNTFNEKTTLVPNAQRMSQSYAERDASLSRSETKSSSGTSPPSALLTADHSQLPTRKASLASTERKPIAESESRRPSPPSHGPIEEIGSFPLPAELPAMPAKELPSAPLSTVTTQRKEVPVATTQFPPRKESAGAGLQISVNDRPLSTHSDDDEPAPPPPSKFFDEPEEMGYDIDPNMIYTGRFSIDNSAPSQQYMPETNRLSVMNQNNRLSIMGMRPLPPDHPEENPEQRANRIRSFYKEYFDSSRPNPTNAYYEDYDADYADYYYYDGWYDPDSEGYYQQQTPAAPWAEPMGRRAMTPPPAGAPRFQGMHDRHYSTMSGGRGGPGGPRGRPPPKKKLPPPKALSSLPTPHLLKEDSALFNASDFAPPTSFRELQNGRRPDSPMGTQRPFSPAVRAYSPLVTSQQGLSPLPSPYELRKSGTFTSLDFSPQVPRFRGQEGGSRAASDAGSIRSARSGISAMHMDAVRAGAYRISRIPKEYVTSKDDFANQLRPKMNLTTPA